MSHQDVWENMLLYSMKNDSLYVKKASQQKVSLNNSNNNNIFDFILWIPFCLYVKDMFV